MKLSIGSKATTKNLAGLIVGTYNGFAKYVEGGNSLGMNADSWTDYLNVEESAALVTRTGNCDVNIKILFPGFGDFEFKNNAVYDDEASAKYWIEGDWITGWGIIGWVDLKTGKIIIDFNPINYSKTQDNGLKPQNIINRYVIRDNDEPFSFKTLFNLEFEGVRR